MKSKLKELAKYVIPFIVAVTIYAFITNYDSTLTMFRRIVQWLTFIVGRFAIGFGLAYILDLLATWLNTRFKMRRPLAITLTYIFFFGLIAWMVIFIVPLIGESVTQIVSMSSSVYERLPGWMEELSAYVSPDVFQNINDFVNESVASLIGVMKGLLNYATISNFVTSAGRQVMDIFFGLVISAYALIEKKSLIRNARRFTYAALKTERADALVLFTRKAHHIFSRFLVGKIIDSGIVLIISLILYTIFDVPLTPFMAVVAGVTNMIPYFGPLVGGVISCLIMLCFEPIYVLIVLAIVVAVQTLDGLVLGPKILGDAVGISPLLTIIAVTLGGDMGGFLGMFIGVPVLATAKKLLYDEWIAKRTEAQRQRRDELLLEAGAKPLPPDMPLDVETQLPGKEELVKSKKGKKPKK